MLFLAVILLLVGLACSAVTGGGDTPPQPEVTDVPVQPVEEPTSAPEPTAVPPVEEPTQAPLPTVEPQSESRDFFVEEFDSNFVEDDWQSFTLGTGEADNLVIEQQDDYMLFDLGDEDLYVYYMYAPYIYENVSLTLSAEN
jgi:hypothetical protein